MPDSKLVGGLLLIVGTSIGGGMLALPVSTAAVGFANSIVFLFLCWLVMTAGALLVLEVNLRLPAGSNMISMAKSTLGLPGQVIAWMTYLFLLYTLLAAYISGGSDVFNGLLHKINVHLSDAWAAVLFTALFGLIVYSGIRSVDYVNRGLMFGKLGVYLLLVIIISPHVSPKFLTGGSSLAITGSLMILVTSFGFASIVPSLREYFEDDVRALRKAILLGSLIPLTCYILWDAVIMGVVARDGQYGLLALMQSEHATSGLSDALSHAVRSNSISAFFGVFSSVCMLTAFLGVSLGLFDFLADGLKLGKSGQQGKFTLALTFLPPLLLVLVKPGIYLQALSYAGICCVILLLLLPTIMAWRGRKTCTGEVMPMIPGGNLSLSLLMLIAVFLLFISL
ncbi:amino acid permease [Legionella israelensis]|uniref:Tyrosine-specific transport protein n=1 Tax=Legionella israelensis TaxID=454 RepID=A0A0W0V373_9GAMM|nr:aromatic amino acid transport family protein [Legionella israelensis]KTD14278.1 tyrosine-specific transport protein [Legionella israelensis]QBS10564.1 tryptophan/tyrosine permease [Legionella israelensis]SCX93731.1 tyrosine-specific transport protein [Legionella israelensis DSM 19235]STX57505.1 tryptophan/tyrosine permease [Legionella israelensis]